MTRNIVLIVLDTVRKDYFDEYANKISELSDSSFDQCRAASSWSVPSHASMFTGLLPHQHNIHSESFTSDFDFGNELDGMTFLSELPEYKHFATSSNLYINQKFGFDRLFDKFSDHSMGSHYTAVPFPEVSTNFSSDSSHWAMKQLDGVRASLNSENPAKSFCNGFWHTFGEYIEKFPIPRVGDNGAKANAQAIRRFAGETDKPFFIFANFMDAHNPLQNSILFDQSLHSVSNSWSSNECSKWELLLEDCADEKYTENYRQLYGASIDYLDRVVAKLVSDINSLSDDETTIIITADHGHNLGYDFEDGLFHHTASLSEGILHVPLEIINPPSQWPKYYTDMVSHLNLPEMIKLIRDEAWDESIFNQNTVAAENIGLLGQDNKVNFESEKEIDHEYWNRMIRCAYIDDTKFEWDSVGNTRQFTIDPARPCRQARLEENRRLPNSLQSRFESDINEYKSEWSSKAQNLSFNSNTAENLRDLGYL